ncbi:TetR/AcrR family transcriptional regulator [Paraburkholderia sp.]|uniref:TetR/AcrR family transcriptional regulator n=1 Tax=Paraburkholderia sp. TaxID=1926495 RepID=UPI0025CD9FC7|nr:TetR/AcrR family transcriptional regulator [Paraburkholderia sp.]
MPNEQHSSRKRRALDVAPSGAAPHGLRAQGVRTHNAIIRIATKALLEDGLLDFSLRSVALRAGISVSNLQYYFPTRLDVMRAVMTPLVESYIHDLKQALESNASPRESLDAILDRTLRDVKDSKVVALWWHFFSIAAADPGCARLLDDWYETVTADLAKLIRIADPARTETGSAHIAVLLISMVDGLTVHLGSARSNRAYMHGLEEKYLATARALVCGKSPETEAAPRFFDGARNRRSGAGKGVG